MCGPCASVPHLASSQTSTDVSSGFVGSHSIEGAPGSGAAFSLPLGSVWSAQRSPVSPFLPQPPGPSLRQNYKGPPTAGSSLCPPAPARFFLLSNPPPYPTRRPPPRPASIRRRYSIHRRRALITKQDYGPSLRTTCQGACSLSCSLSTAHTLQRRACLCVCVVFFLFCFFGREMEAWLPQTVTQSKYLCAWESFFFPLYAPPHHLLINIYLTALQSMNERSVNT